MDSSLRSSSDATLRHTYNFHARTQWPDPVSTYTVFHGSPAPPPPYVPKYFTKPGTTALASKNLPTGLEGLYSFKATAERTGTDSATGRPSYRYGAAANHAHLTPSPYSSLAKPTSTTFGASGLPPVPYKSYLTEYVDEYREPVEHMDTLKGLTTRFGTTGGSRVTKRSTRSDGLPKYESRVVAF